MCKLFNTACKTFNTTCINFYTACLGRLFFILNLLKMYWICFYLLVNFWDSITKKHTHNAKATKGF